MFRQKWFKLFLIGVVVSFAVFTFIYSLKTPSTFSGVLSKTENFESLQKEIGVALQNVHELPTLVPASNELHILTTLCISNGTKAPKYDNFTLDEVWERDGELFETLERNINHTLVKRVHLFYTNDDVLQIIEKSRWKYRHKIVPVKLKRRLHVVDFFLYANKNLIDKTAVILKADIFIGKGFEKINTERIREEKVLYSLTKHCLKEGYCKTNNHCIDGKSKVFHDAHVFRLRDPLDTQTLISRLNYPIDMWHAEKGLIWTFRYLLGYTVRNPCKVLHTYHNHLSKVQASPPNANYSIYYLGFTSRQANASEARVEDALMYG